MIRSKIPLFLAGRSADARRKNERISMQNMRLIFSDIDGTLLNSQHQLPLATKTAIAQVVAAGIPFFLVSSRSPLGMLPIYQELQLTTPFISYGGALVMDSAQAVMQSTGMPQQTAIALRRQIEQDYPEVIVNAFSFQHWVTSCPGNDRLAEEEAITFSKSQYGLIEDILPAGQIVHKVHCMGPAEQILAIEAYVNATCPDLSASRSSSLFLEIMHRNASKANAVKFLCDHYQVPLAQTLSFGDNFNDLDMLKTTGQSVAMANAPVEIQQQATYVALSSDQCGVADFLQKRFLTNSASSL